MIFIAIVEPWLIVISDSEEEVEIIFQLVVEEQTPQALELGHVEEEVGVSVCLSVQFLVWYWVYFCIQKYRLKIDFVGYIQKSHYYHLYIHNFF